MRREAPESCAVGPGPRIVATQSPQAGVRDLAGEEVEEAFQLVGVAAERGRQLDRIGILRVLDRPVRRAAVGSGSARHGRGRARHHPRQSGRREGRRRARHGPRCGRWDRRAPARGSRSPTASAADACARPHRCPRRPRLPQAPRSPPLQPSLGRNPAGRLAQPWRRSDRSGPCATTSGGQGRSRRSSPRRTTCSTPKRVRGTSRRARTTSST